MSCTVCHGLRNGEGGVGAVYPCLASVSCIKAAPEYFTRREREAAGVPMPKDHRATSRELRNAVDDLGARVLLAPHTPLADAARAAERSRLATEADDQRSRDTKRGAQAWRQTASGAQWWPLDPRPGDFAIDDIAHGLAHLSRYGGQASRFYSVAEHSVLCSFFGDPKYARRRLMHDAAEAVFGFDLAGPLKRHPAFHAIRALEEPVEAALFTQYACTEPGDWKEVDVRMLLDERNALFGTPPADWHIPGEPLGAVIIGMRPTLAKDLFLARFAELFPEYGGP